MNLYHCEICGHPVDPSHTNVAHLVTAWLKGGRGAVVRVVEKQYRYAHVVCAESTPKAEQVEKLF